MADADLELLARVKLEYERSALVAGAQRAASEVQRVWDRVEASARASAKGISMFDLSKISEYSLALEKILQLNSKINAEGIRVYEPGITGIVADAHKLKVAKDELLQAAKAQSGRFTAAERISGDPDVVRKMAYERIFAQKQAAAGSGADVDIQAIQIDALREAAAYADDFAAFQQNMESLTRVMALLGESADLLINPLDAVDKKLRAITRSAVSDAKAQADLGVTNTKYALDQAKKVFAGAEAKGAAGTIGLDLGGSDARLAALAQELAALQNRIANAGTNVDELNAATALLADAQARATAEYNHRATMLADIAPFAEQIGASEQKTRAATEERARVLAEGTSDLAALDAARNQAQKDIIAGLKDNVARSRLGLNEANRMLKTSGMPVALADLGGVEGIRTLISEMRDQLTSANRAIGRAGDDFAGLEKATQKVTATEEKVARLLDLLASRLSIAAAQPESQIQKFQDVAGRAAGREQAREAIDAGRQAQRRIYETSGNPFLVMANISQRITGIKPLADGLRVAVDEAERLDNEFQTVNKEYQELLNQKKSGVSFDKTRYNEVVQQMDVLAEKRNQALNQVSKLEKQTRGAGFYLKAGGDFVVQQMLTGAMFTFAFQGAALVMQTLGAAAVQFGRDLIDPLNRARDMAKEMVDILKNAGGPERFGLLFGLTEAEVGKLKELAATGGVADTTTAIIKSEELAAEAKRRGISVQQLTMEEEAKRLAKSRLANSEAGQEAGGGVLGILAATLAGLAAVAATVGTGGLALPVLLGLGAAGAGTAAVTSQGRGFVGGELSGLAPSDSKLGAAYTAEQQRSLAKTYDVFLRDRALAIFESVQGQLPSKAQVADAQAALNLFKNSGVPLERLSAGARFAAESLQTLATKTPTALESQERADLFNKMTGTLGLGSTLAGLTGNQSDLYAGFVSGTRPEVAIPELNEYFDASEALLKSQAALSAAQLRANQASLGAQWRQIELQKQQIKASVAKSMIGAVGMTGFELAAQIAEAREQARIQRIQLRAQAAQLAQQQKIAAKTAAVDSNTKKLKILETQEALRVARDKERLEQLRLTFQKLLGLKDNETLGQQIADRLRQE